MRRRSNFQWARKTQCYTFRPPRRHCILHIHVYIFACDRVVRGRDRAQITTYYVLLNLPAGHSTMLRRRINVQHRNNLVCLVGIVVQEPYTYGFKYVSHEISQ